VVHQSNRCIALASDARQITESIRLSEKARAIYVALTDRPDVLQRLAQHLGWKWYARRKADNASRALEACAREMIELFVVGKVPYYELLAFPAFLDSVLDALNVGAERVSLDELDIEDDRAESAGNHAFARRRVRGQATSQELREEVEYHRWDARVSNSLADALEREADKKDRDAGVPFPRPMGVPVVCAQ
jgi:ATP phosphoribosyltransferase regulatory subunit HisZ